MQEKIKDEELGLIWSYILDIENDQNPFEEKRNAIEKWQKFAAVDIDETERLVDRAKHFMIFGIKAKDALHVSAAIEGKTDCFVTTDDRLLKKLAMMDEIRAENPVDIVEEI